MYIAVEDEYVFRLMNEELINREDPEYIPDTSLYEDLTVYLFHDYFYFFMVTCSTTGYGDIFPLTNYGRVIIIIFMVFFISTLQ